MENGSKIEASQKRGAHHRPILCRTLDEETGVAIEAMVATGIFHSVAEGVVSLVKKV